jgi:phosphoenolpyruvate---glycerone phosphotransferase subunit DhaL
VTTSADVVRAVAAAVEASADELNRLDGVAGDGDLGITMRTAAGIVTGALPDLEGRPLPDALKACALALARGAPSTAGTLIATGLLRAAAAAADASDEPDAAQLARILRAACSGIAERGQAQPGSKTMLDALEPATEAVERSAAAGKTVPVALARAADAADAGARATTTMRALHGRAGWLAERSAGHEDAGARLVAIAFLAAAQALPDDPA